MKLSELLKDITYTGTFEDRQVVDIASDSRRVREGSVFVCIKGLRFDGHTAAEAALQAGAAAVVTERKLGLPNEILVQNTRFALAKLCSAFFGRPQDKLRLIAVTGTNGKTTIANVVKQALDAMGHKTGVIGTLGNRIGEIELPAKFTTPEPWDLEMLFDRMVTAGCEFAVMEASSQALEQGRLLDLHFECGIFTNLSQDHLDYHGDMRSYFQCKKMLFDICDTAVINYDDPAGKELLAEVSIPAVSYSIGEAGATYRAENTQCEISGVQFDLCGADGTAEHCAFAMPGNFSIYNAMACVCALHSVGMDMKESCAAVSAAGGVSGRCEVLHAGECTVICDYAHTEDALRKLLSSLKPYVKGRLVVLFGCAGRRDKTKRPPMAKAVCEYADFVVLSSDNPRDEDPLSITYELRPYVMESGLPFTVIPDRYYAVNWAVRALKEGDVLVLCGKGHEDYQVIDGCTVYLDERRIVRDYYRQREGN
ncbi:MAG: UDP-N-acetylmuramoyl-L-alanyl-D-glutamate--2,6-diaminopimelate ligase [Oscillospiraceae bacterium]|nr:UDP-N-acetylmuramoyl-L-alanyl-D-glutamate--2,6-diaminopimelate ligase [Oscillospiraceae bacterium]